MNILKGIFILTYLCLHFYSFNLYAYEARSEEIAIDSIHGKIAQHKYDLYTEGVTAQLAGEIVWNLLTSKRAKTTKIQLGCI